MTCEDIGVDPRTNDDVAAMAEADAKWFNSRPAPIKWQPDAWRSLPPTDKQVFFLMNKGRCVPLTRGEASDMIGEQLAYEERRNRDRYEAGRLRRQERALRWPRRKVR